MARKSRPILIERLIRIEEKLDSLLSVSKHAETSCCKKAALAAMDYPKNIKLDCAVCGKPVVR